MSNLRYLVIGAGGVGGCITAYLAHAGLDVTVIARGKHLEVMQQHGLKLIRPQDELTIPVKATTEEAYEGKADVIFVCVKGYSLDSINNCISKAAHPDTIVIPVLNIYGTGERLQKLHPDIEVLNGCIYIAAAIDAPGIIRMSGSIFRIVYGRVDGDCRAEILHTIESDLKDSGITPLLTAHVQRDTLQKFAFVSPMGAAGAYGSYTAGDYKHEGAARELLISCIREIDALAHAMGIPFPVDIVETNMKIMESLADDGTTSLQKDLAKGGMTEADGLIREVVRLGEKYLVPTPSYRMIAEKIGV